MLKKLFGNRWMKNDRGMTLVEIMIVLVILGSLAAFLVPGITKQLKKARVKEARLAMADIAKNMELYYTDCGSFPTSEQGISALVQDPGTCSNWGPEPYMKKVPRDPWGNEYIYEFDGNNFNIISYGADKKPGGGGYDKDLQWNEPAEQQQSNANSNNNNG